MTFSSVISFPRPYDKEGAPACGIYLHPPKKTSFKLFVVQLRAVLNALNNSRYQKNMHALELHFPKKIFEKERQQASQLVAMCRGAGVVAIVRGDVGLCIECGAEGVILSELEDIATARHILGASAIIGFDCGNSQEKAEVALEKGVDYVTFSGFFAAGTSKKYADVSLLEWWSSKTALPAAAFGKINVERVIALTKSGAGFIGAGAWVWEHEEGPARAIYWLQEAIEHGLSSVKIN